MMNSTHPIHASLFYEPLLTWFDAHGRKNLPWQHPRTLYRVWVSEIMLQQTQVVTVMRYFDAFMTRFPTVADLAAASQDEVLSMWSGLGYYARARNLWKSAQFICETLKGEMPTTVEAWTQLPGVGRSTAGAILAQSLNHRVPILDGNVKRVLSRYFAFDECVDDKKSEPILWGYSEALLPTERLADYTQALMDLGASLCHKTQPRCEICPLTATCAAHEAGSVLNYPIRKIKKAIPTKQARLLVILNAENHLFLVKRANQGIWGGLWSLPEAEEKQLPKNKHSLPALLHTFTHFKLHIQPYLMKNAKQPDEAIGSWFSFEAAFGLGLPAPIRKILENVQETVCQSFFVEN